MDVPHVVLLPRRAPVVGTPELQVQYPEPPVVVRVELDVGVVSARGELWAHPAPAGASIFRTKDAPRLARALPATRGLSRQDVGIEQARRLRRRLDLDLCSMARSAGPSRAASSGRRHPPTRRCRFRDRTRPSLRRRSEAAATWRRRERWGLAGPWRDRWRRLRRSRTVPSPTCDPRLGCETLRARGFVPRGVPSPRRRRFVDRQGGRVSRRSAPFPLARGVARSSRRRSIERLHSPRRSTASPPAHPTPPRSDSGPRAPPRPRRRRRRSPRRRWERGSRRSSSSSTPRPGRCKRRTSWAATGRRRPAKRVRTGRKVRPNGNESKNPRADSSILDAQFRFTSDAIEANSKEEPPPGRGARGREARLRWVG